MRVAAVLDLRREPEVDPQVKTAFFTAGFERCERRQESRADARIRRSAVVPFREHPKGIHVSPERERPAIRHLHGQALRLGRRGDAERETQQQQRETLHTRTPPWGVGLLGSLLVWLLTYACRVTDLIGKSGAYLLLRAGGRRGRRPECSPPETPRRTQPSGRPWPRIPRNIGYDPPLNAIAGWFSAPCAPRARRHNRPQLAL